MNKAAQIKFKVKRENTLKKEVSNKVFPPAAAIIRKKGLNFEDFLSDVPYCAAYLLDKRERVEWHVYRQFIVNTRSSLSIADYESIGAEFIKSESYVEGVIGFFLLTSKITFNLAAGKILERISSNFFCIKLGIEYPESNLLRITIELDQGYEHFPEFAYGNRGVFKEIGKRIGLKECRVDLQFLPAGAVYEIRWKKHDFFFKIRRGFRWLFSINRAFRELTDVHEELVRDYEKLEDYKNNLEVKVTERTTALKTAHDKLAETIELLKQAHQTQNKFFTNISHEFRTPLTLILGPVKNMINKNPDSETAGELMIIYKNACRLLNLVNQLLDISKLESGVMKLKAVPQNIIPLLKMLLESFTSAAVHKEITLRFETFSEDVLLFIDKDKVQKIITNIISNALKFTPPGGEVTMYVTADDKYLNINITDTGIGIPEEMIPHIFDRFYQVNSTYTGEQQGTGIGLSLSKELIELHKGLISVSSKEGKGTSFIVSLPFGKEHLAPEEIGEPAETGRLGIDDSEYYYEGQVNLPASTSNIEELSPNGDNAKPKKPLLLIIEDNSDVRNYIKSILANSCHILEAADGEEGWRKSFEFLPDLIICDIMMPKLDGLNLCGKIKTEEATCHIPVILLTAKAAVGDKMEGFEKGADDYLIKPFEPAELKLRIRNLIEQRNRIHEHYRKNGLYEIDEKQITTFDRLFMKKTAEIISENISDPAFGVEQLAEKLLVSRSLLLKKIEALAGEAPNELLRRIRLNKAAKLIASNFGNISEIALEVGYNSPSYFAECFKRQFGVPPSQYHLNAREEHLS